MLVKKRLSEGNDRVGICVSDRSNGSLLGVTAGVAGRSNDNFFTDSPVKNGTVLHSAKSDAGSTNLCSRGDISPSDFSFDTVQFELTVVDADDLVSEDRHIGVILGAPHSDGKLRGVAILFSTGLHVATLHEDVVSVEGSVMVGISVRREDQRTFNSYKGEFGTDINIEEKMLSLGDADSFTVTRCEVTAPSLRV